MTRPNRFLLCEVPDVFTAWAAALSFGPGRRPHEEILLEHVGLKALGSPMITAVEREIVADALALTPGQRCGGYLSGAQWCAILWICANHTFGSEDALEVEGRCADFLFPERRAEIAAARARMP